MNKFKPGDIVECINKRFKNETVGKTYTVLDGDHLSESKDYYSNRFWFQVEEDDYGFENDYLVEDFKLWYVEEFNNKLSDLIKE